MDDSTRDFDKSSALPDNETDFPSSQTEKKLVESAQLTSTETSSKRASLERSLQPSHSLKTCQESDRTKAGKASSVESVTIDQKSREHPTRTSTGENISLRPLISATGHGSTAKHATNRKRPKTYPSFPDRKIAETPGIPVGSDCCGRKATAEYISTIPSSSAAGINLGHDSSATQANPRKRTKTVPSFPAGKLEEMLGTPVKSDSSKRRATLDISSRPSTSAAGRNSGHDSSQSTQSSPLKRHKNVPSFHEGKIEQTARIPVESDCSGRTATADSISTIPSSSASGRNLGHDSQAAQASPRKRHKTVPNRKTEETPRMPVESDCRGSRFTMGNISSRPSTSAAGINRGRDGAATQEASPKKRHKAVPSIPERKIDETSRIPVESDLSGYRYILPKPLPSPAVVNRGQDNPGAQEHSEINYWSTPLFEMEISTFNVISPSKPLKRDVGTNTLPGYCPTHNPDPFAVLHICPAPEPLKKDVGTNTEPVYCPIHNPEPTALHPSYDESDQRDEMITNPVYPATDQSSVDLAISVKNFLAEVEVFPSLESSPEHPDFTQETLYPHG